MKLELQVTLKRFWKIRVVAYYLWAKASGKSDQWFKDKISSVMICRMNGTTVRRFT